MIFISQELHHTTVAPLILFVCLLAFLDADECLGLFKKFLINREQ